MKTNILRLYLAPALLAAMLLLLSQVRWPDRKVQATEGATVPQANTSSALVFVVSGDSPPELNLDPLVMVDRGVFKPPYDEANEVSKNQFVARYFSAARRYRMLFGGGEAGSVTIKQSAMGCNTMHANVTVDTRVPLGDKVMALATDSDSLGRKSSARRAPTDSERTAVMNLVRSIYQQRGVSATLLRRMQTTNLTATDLDGDGRFELIGSFVIEIKPRDRRDLFLIAEQAGAGYKASLINYQSYRMPPELFNSAVDFVDQLDLDGDGVGEVVAIQSGFDAYAYLIYKRERGQWRKVLTVTGDAC